MNVDQPSTAPADPFICIGVPTFKRPKGLRELLQSLAVQQTQLRLMILVADNEGEGGAGMACVQDLAAAYPYPIKALPVPERGISQVRNALLHEAFHRQSADYLAMIDDDETAEPTWIQALYDAAKRYGATVTGGKVNPQFSSPPPAWTEGINLFYRAQTTLEGRVNLIEGTTAVLIEAAGWRQSGAQRFDPRYALTGGEDKEFFTRMKKAGAQFAYAGRALSYERFDTSRLSWKWATQRSRRTGQCDMRIHRLHSGWLKSLIELLKAIMLMGALPVLWVIFPPRRAFYALKIQRQIGKFEAWMGRSISEYATIHGQ
ncbi:MAG: glycosyltransferase [Bacteroidota bacterium]